MLHRTLRLLLARGVAAAARKPHIVSPGRKTKLAVLGLKMLQSMQRFQVRALNLEAVGQIGPLAPNPLGRKPRVAKTAGSAADSTDTI
ncbi:hypothetical protein FOBRF1_008749 [Fusarium oxysporum]